jgi:hypothetical protein
VSECLKKEVIFQPHVAEQEERSAQLCNGFDSHEEDLRDVSLLPDPLISVMSMKLSPEEMNG